MNTNQAIVYLTGNCQYLNYLLEISLCNLRQKAIELIKKNDSDEYAYSIYEYASRYLQPQYIQHGCMFVLKNAEKDSPKFYKKLVNQMMDDYKKNEISRIGTTITESQLRNIVTESVKKVLKDDDYNCTAIYNAMGLLFRMDKLCYQLSYYDHRIGNEKIHNEISNLEISIRELKKMLRAEMETALQARTIVQGT